MFTTTELFGDTDWELTSERSADESLKNQKQTKSRETLHATLKEQNRFEDDETVRGCSENQCLTGMFVALPVSLLAWGGIFTFFYLMIRYFQ